MNSETRVYDSIFDLLPSEANPTPLVRLNKLNPSPEFHLYAKLEWLNPFGSVKDRAAWEMLQDLEARGELSAERGIVEPTSGNTGLSLAAMARVRGYRTRTVVPNAIPLEKKVLLKIVGADLDVVADALCPVPGQGDGSVGLAQTYAKAQASKYTMPNQYENEQNLKAHRRTTGPEIWRQTEGKITHFFASMGTCGTVIGTGGYLKEKNPDIRVVAVQPTEGSDVPGLRTVKQLSSSPLFDRDLVDDILEIDAEHSYTNALALCQTEGLLAGPSSGLILEGARRIIERDGGGVGVMIFPDQIFKYASSMMKHIPALATGNEP